MNISQLSYSLLLTVFMLNRVVCISSKHDMELQPLALILLTIVFISIIYYIPVYAHCSISELCYGILGDISITTLLIFAVQLATIISGIDILSTTAVPAAKRYFAIVVIIAGVLLYGSTCGFISYDIYALGYHPGYVLLIPLIIIMLGLSYYARFYAWIWLIALISFYYHLTPANNLWDCLFDPVLFVTYLNKIITYNVRINTK